MRRAAAVSLTAAGVLAGTPGPALAHGISQRADLPIPLWLFAWGAALVLVASFVALAVLWPEPVLAGLRSRVLFRLPAPFGWVAGAVGIAAFAVVVWAGLAGTQAATANLAPTAIFVLVWVGIPFASVMLGDIFAAVSPWRALARGVGWGAGRIAGGLPSPIDYPERLGRWPAALGLLLFAWVELAWSGRESPASLAAVALAYAVVMLLGMSCFGVEKWTRNADAFGVAFGLFALLAPLEWSQGRCRVRWPLTGALRMAQVPGSAAVLVVLIGSTSFDGFSQGGLWTGASGLAQRLTDAFAGLGLGPEAAVQAGYTAGLLLVVAVVAVLYRVAVAGMARAGGGRPGAERLSLSFAHALIPIAFAYLVAHYFSLLAFQGQAAAFLVSDPLGNGWDLFGTSSATIDYGILGANAIWYVQVAALLIGHVAALALAHDRALATWSDRRTAVRSQYWMLVVMVAFTCLGLWLLSAAAQ